MYRLPVELVTQILNCMEKLWPNIKLFLWIILAEAISCDWINVRNEPWKCIEFVVSLPGAQPTNVIIAPIGSSFGLKGPSVKVPILSR